MEACIISTPTSIYTPFKRRRHSQGSVTPAVRQVAKESCIAWNGKQHGPHEHLLVRQIGRPEPEI